MDQICRTSVLHNCFISAYFSGIGTVLLNYSSDIWRERTVQNYTNKMHKITKKMQALLFLLLVTFPAVLLRKTEASIHLRRSEKYFGIFKGCCTLPCDTSLQVCSAHLCKGDCYCAKHYF